MLEACSLEEFASFHPPILKLEEDLEVGVGEFELEEVEEVIGSNLLF